MADHIALEGVQHGEGYSIASVEELGEGPGFRKVRSALGVTAFGVNAIVLPAGAETGFHYHDVQQELYFVHRGTIEIVFGDGAAFTLTPGSLARVDAPVARKICNVSSQDALYICVGGDGGYVGRDGRLPDGEQRMHDAGGSGA